VRIAPKHDGGLLGGVELAWDASNGVPLRGAIYSSDSSSPVVQLEATDVAFEAIPESVFDARPPAGRRRPTRGSLRRRRRSPRAGPPVSSSRSS